jgi:hypothetical protein
LTSGNNSHRAAINHFSYDEAHTYLGDSLAPNLQMQTGDIALMKKRLTFSRRLVSSSLSQHDVWIAYFAVFQPAMTYTFPVTHHSAARLHKIQSAPTRSTLTKLGFNRTTAHAVAFGPSRYGGLRLRNLRVKQGIAGLTILICHLRAQTQQGCLLLITLAWWQQVIGIQTPLLEYPKSPVPHDTPHLLSAHRHFLAEIEGSLHVADLQGTAPPPLRDNDVCLMEAVLALPSLKPAAIAAFNRVRLHFGVMFLSEIATVDGRSLARDAWQGHRSRTSPYLWPYQSCPGPRSFRGWRPILSDLFLSGARKRVSSRTLDLSLRQPVGSWLPNSEPFRLQWEAFCSWDHNALYVGADDGTYT